MESFGGLVIQWWATSWPLILSGLNSTFMTSLIGAFAGAWGGALIVERTRTKNALTQRIRSTNSAIALAVGMLNTFGALKAQHIYGIVSSYRRERERVLEALASGERELQLRADMMVLHEMSAPTSAFQDLMMNEVGNSGRALGASMELLSAIQNLNDALRMRNQLIEEFRTSGGNPSQYFGITNGDSTDTRYMSVIEGLDKYTDDCIFFSNLVVLDLQKYGKKIQKRYGRNAPPVSSVNTVPEKASGLVPPNSEYESWLVGWKERDE